MRRGLRVFATLCLALSTLAPAWSCSSRSETPVAGPDSTLSYPARQPGGVAASITLCRGVGKKSGKRLGAGQVFTIDKGAKVYAFVDLENSLALGQRDLALHLVWLNPDGSTLYAKQVSYTPGDSSPWSSISATPGKREPGRYTFRVYLFRELIAEKSFRLRTEAEAEMEKAQAKAARRAARAAARTAPPAADGDDEESPAKSSE